MMVAAPTTEVYPTPVQSPFLKNGFIHEFVWDLAVPPKYMQTEVKKQPLGEMNSNILVPKSKRKNQLPQRAISQPKDQVDRSFQRIVTLDVFSAFKENPSVLLSRRPSITESEASSTRSSTGPDLKSKGSVSALQSSAKALPTFIIEKEPLDFDLSSFQDTKGAPSVSWKGAQPLAITPEMADYEILTSEEIRTCATLRILPQQYLEIKRTMLTAVSSYGPFKKREAQTWFRIDVNKV
jgi:hypothetical protein